MNATAEVRVFPHTHFQQLEMRFEAEYGVMWHFMKPKPRPVFNVQLLAELRAFHASIEQQGGVTWDNGAFMRAGDSTQVKTIADIALYAHGTGALPPGVEGGLDAQTVYRD